MSDDKKKYRFPNPVGFAFRVLFLVFLVFIFVTLVQDYIKATNSRFKKKEYAEDTSFYDSSYYERQFGVVRTYLYLDEIPDDESKVFGKYWEIVHAYEHYIAAKDFSAAAKAGVENAKARAEEEKDALLEIYNNPKFEENKVMLQELVDKL